MIKSNKVYCFVMSFAFALSVALAVVRYPAYAQNQVYTKPIDTLQPVIEHDASKLHSFTVWKFRDGNVTCYLMSSPQIGGNTGISCLK